MRLGQVQVRPDWDESRRVDLLVGHVVVPFDVVEIDSLSNVIVLVQIGQISLQIRIIENAPQAALEVNIVNDIETNKRAKESPIGLNNTAAE